MKYILKCFFEECVLYILFYEMYRNSFFIEVLNNEYLLGFEARIVCGGICAWGFFWGDREMLKLDGV